MVGCVGIGKYLLYIGENLSEGEGIGHSINVTEDRIRQTFTDAL